MNGTEKEKGAARATVSRHLRLPVDLDKWLQKYARRKGFNNPVEAVRQLVRDERQRDEAAA